MKKLVVLYGDNCAYCKKAKMLIRRAVEKNPSFSSVNVQYVKDNSPEGKGFAHKYIPAFYIEEKHVLEGNPQMSDIQRMLQECLANEEILT
jgi:protein-disulfide isomerase